MSLFSEVKVLVDEPGSGVFWTDQQVYDAINEAQLEVYATTKWVVSTATMTATASAETCTIPVTLMIPQFILGTQSYRMPMTSYVQLENFNRQWRLETPSAPSHFVEMDAFELRPFPLLAATTNYRVVGVSWPTEIDGATLDITAPRLLKQAIIHKAAAVLLEATLPDLSELMEKTAMDYEIQAAIQIRKAQPHNIKRLRPANTFQSAQSGSVWLGRRLG